MNNDVEPIPAVVIQRSEDQNPNSKPRRITKRRLRKLWKAAKQRKVNWREAHLAPLEKLIRWGVPATALHLYAKWWQLERWLRDLAQLELQARFTKDWKAQIAHIESRRDGQAQNIQYMPSSDDANPLGYADIGDLRKLFDTHWELFAYALPPKTRWTGTIDTLIAVRRRIAHCRAPHQDDLARVDQALRDLEDGARACLQAYTSREWLRRESSPELKTFYPDGQLYERLKHAGDQYETTMRLHRSTRPWSTEAKPGMIYHAMFRCGRHPPDPARVWEYLAGAIELPDLIHLNFYAFNNVEAVFAETSPDTAVQLIDSVLEAVLVSQRAHSDLWYEDWATSAQSLDYRVHADDYFAKAADLVSGARIFFDPT